ncbi:MAG: DUF2892 domain-containing protein [Bacteroidales bacterium]|nr:DUF2892 domain-containing protein [Bacteroidales bacterium]MCF8403140.1 DUF2892 domain-containing protein [Bacteroidales bacterium]
MKTNMGSADGIIRILLGVIIAVLYFTTNNLTGVIGTILVIIGVVFLLTSLVSFCPLYLPLGLCTKKKITK